MRKVFEIGGVVAAAVLIAFGIALLLTGIGFAILAIGGALRHPGHALNFGKHATPRTGAPLPTA